MISRNWRKLGGPRVLFELIGISSGCGVIEEYSETPEPDENLPCPMYFHFPRSSSVRTPSGKIAQSSRRPICHKRRSCRGNFQNISESMAPKTFRRAFGRNGISKNSGGPSREPIPRLPRLRNFACPDSARRRARILSISVALGR